MRMSIWAKIDEMEKAIAEADKENSVLWDHVEDFEDEAEAAREAGAEEDVKRFTRKANVARKKADASLQRLEYMRAYLDGLKFAAENCF